MAVNSINEFRMNFARVFHSKVKPALLSFENDRIRIRKKALFLSFLVFCIVVGVLFFYFDITTSESILLSIVLDIIFGWVAAYAVYSYFKKQFENTIKMTIMPILMPAFGDFQWLPASTIYDEEIRMSKLYTRFDRMEEDDNFIGSYKDVPIRISEVKLSYETRDSRGRRHRHTEFKGVLISLEIPKRFTGHTIVRPRVLLGSGPYKEVKLEDPEFSKRFYVSSTDQVEARYLLTTAFMQRYKNIQKAFNANNIACSFLNNKLLLAVSVSKDLFSLGDLNKPVADTNQFTIFLNEIISILEMIEELKVYQNIGL